MNGRLTWGLLACALVLGLLVAAGVRNLDAPVPQVPVRPPAAGTLPADATGSETVAIAPLPALDAMTQTVERPLFDASRQPSDESEDAPDAAPVPVSATPPTVALTGIFIAQGEPVALVREAAESQPRRVREGDSVAGWTVAAIGPETVTLSQGTREHTVVLRKFEPAPAPARARAAQTARNRAKAAQAGAAAVPRRPRRAQRTEQRRTPSAAEARRSGSDR